MSTDTEAPRRRPQQQRSRETFDSILDAAEAVVVEADGDGLTTTAVADRAGLAVGSLYRYFADVDAIRSAVVDRHLAAFAGLVRSTVGARTYATAEDAGRALAHAAADYYRSEPAFRRIWFDAGAEHRSPSEGDRGFVGLFRSLLITSELVDAGDPDSEVSILVRWTVAEALLDLAFRRDPDGDEAVLDRLDHLLGLETWSH